MADYPSSIFVPRDYENRSGIIYDEYDKKRIFAEDFQNIWGEIIAIETALGVNIDETLSYITGVCSDFEDHAELPCHSNLYKARVYLANNKSATKNDWSKVAFDSKSYDPNNNFDNSTNFRYTVPITGYYIISSTVGFLTPSSGTMPLLMSLGIYLNGSLKSRGNNLYLSLSTSQLTIMNCSDILYLEKNQYIEIFGYNGPSASNNSTYSGFESRTNFSIALLSQ